MSTDKTTVPLASINPANTAPAPIVNTTDATRGTPLAMRARARRAELQAALGRTPVSDKRERDAIAVALAAVDKLLTGDTAHLTDATAADLNRWLESAKHLAEVAPVAKPAPAH